MYAAMADVHQRVISTGPLGPAHRRFWGPATTSKRVGRNKVFIPGGKVCVLSVWCFAPFYSHQFLSVVVFFVLFYMIDRIKQCDVCRASNWNNEYSFSKRDWRPRKIRVELCFSISWLVNSDPGILVKQYISSVSLHTFYMQSAELQRTRARLRFIFFLEHELGFDSWSRRNAILCRAYAHPLVFVSVSWFTCLAVSMDA